MADVQPKQYDDPAEGAAADHGALGAELAGLREEVARLAAGERAAAAERHRLELRVQELNAALRGTQQEYLEMLDRLQEREEDAVRRALRELSWSEERFRLVVESVQDYAIFTVDPAGRVTSWNTGAARITGYAEQYAVGTPLWALRPGEPPANAERLLTTAAREGRAEHEGWRARSDGSRFWASEIVSPLRAAGGELIGFVSITRDLTELREKQYALEDTAAELESTVDELHLRSAEAEQARAAAEAAERRANLLAEAGRVLSASFEIDALLASVAELAVARMCELCAILLMDGPGSVRLATVSDVDRARERRARELYEQALSDEAQTREWLASLRDRAAELVPDLTLRPEGSLALGVLRRLGLACGITVPLAARGHVLGALCLGSGQTGALCAPADAALVQEFGRRVAIAIDNARLYEEAIAGNRSKSEFLAVMSHELRTPLNAVIGYADLLMAGITGPVSEAQRTQLGRIKDSARHLLGLIEQILAHSRAEAGYEEARSEPVDLPALVRVAAALTAPMAAAKGLALVVRVPDGPLEIRSDAEKLRQILLNLLSNAVKFTDAGEVEIRAAVVGSDIHVSVRDTGIGISASDAERVFEPFWQVEQSMTRRVGGTGLGLSVSRRLARLLGGDITVKTELGRGSTFTLCLPVGQPRE